MSSGFEHRGIFVERVLGKKKKSFEMNMEV